MQKNNHLHNSGLTLINQFAIMKRLKLISIVSICFLMGCSSHHKTKEVLLDKYPIEKELKHTSIDWINNYCTGAIYTFDTILFIIDHCSDEAMHFYDLKSESIITSVGKKGKGPNEFPTTPNTEGLWYESKNDIIFQIKDFSKQSFAFLSLNKIINSQDIIPVNMVSFPEIYNWQSASLINDSTCVGTASIEKGSLFFYNFNTKTYDWKSERTRRTSQIHPMNEFLWDTEDLRVKRDLSQFVGTFRYLKKIHIYDDNGNLLAKISEKDELTTQDFSIPLFSSENETMLYYGNAILGESVFCVINYRFSRKTNYNSELLVFDYDGNPLAKYILDLPIQQGTVDYTNSRFIGYSIEVDSFITYQLDILDH